MLQACQPGDLGRRGQLVGDEDIVDPVVDHDHGFAHFGTGDADSSGGSQEVGDGRGLVGLAVGPPSRSMSLAIGGDLPDIGFEPIQIDQEHRRVEGRLFSSCIRIHRWQRLTQVQRFSGMSVVFMRVGN